MLLSRAHMGSVVLTVVSRHVVHCYSCIGIQRRSPFMQQSTTSKGCQHLGLDKILERMAKQQLQTWCCDINEASRASSSRVQRTNGVKPMLQPTITVIMTSIRGSTCTSYSIAFRSNSLSVCCRINLNSPIRVLGTAINHLNFKFLNHWLPNSLHSVSYGIVQLLPCGFPKPFSSVTSPILYLYLLTPNYY